MMTPWEKETRNVLHEFALAVAQADKDTRRLFSLNAAGFEKQYRKAQAKALAQLKEITLKYAKDFQPVFSIKPTNERQS